MPSEDIERGERIPILKGLTLLLGNISFWVILFYFAVPSLTGWGIKNWLPRLFSSNCHFWSNKWKYIFRFFGGPSFNYLWLNVNKHYMNPF
jgi:hypothetical protein